MCNSPIPLWTSRLPEFSTRPASPPDADLSRTDADLRPGERRLSTVRPGFSGRVSRLLVDARCRLGAVSASELELRLIEMGFVDEASIACLHEGLIGGDPIAVKLGQMRVALRRREADGVIVISDDAGAAA